MATPQTLQISLSGVLYSLRLYWNNINQYWTMDISTTSGTVLVQGVPLVTGALLLSQYGYMGFPGDLFVQSSNNPDAVPTFSGLGTTSQLYYIQGYGAGASQNQ